MHAIAPARNPFPVAAATIFAVAVFAGFARTYYLKFLFHAPPLTLMLQLHGLLASAWIALHYTQAKLIAAHRVALHRKLGIAGALLGYALVAQAYAVAILGARAGHAPPGRDPLQFLSVSFSTTTIFALLLTAALLLRRRREWHKRLLFLATLGLLVPALGRLDSLLFAPLGVPRAVASSLMVIGLLIWAFVNDRKRLGRIHPAYLYLGTLLVLTLPGRILLGRTEAWLPFAQWLTGS